MGGVKFSSKMKEMLQVMFGGTADITRSKWEIISISNQNLSEKMTFVDGKTYCINCSGDERDVFRSIFWFIGIGTCATATTGTRQRRWSRYVKLIRLKKWQNHCSVLHARTKCSV